MTTFITIVHVIIAIVLIALVLLQDSKSNGALGMGGGSSSNSLLGATGAQTLAAKMTMWTAIVFAVTCLSLTYLTSHSQKSVVDSIVLPTTPAAAPATTDATTPAAVPSDSSAPAAETK